MTYRRYSLHITYTNGATEDFDCTNYRRKDGVYEIYYSDSERLVMDYARPDFELPVVNVRSLFKEDIPEEDR
ncbi:hypothetical protein SEA_FAUST_200 [Streptomyces phage Faust]|uniref:Uncharacterized protein n=1 Tax=Streptomyces phage Faust TaxID=2767565 RepID=A0A7G9UZ17_9CAUD|nr:hypothetical protein PP456_gp087 [Streptomyces phage Faust]QNN99272.1 hypothetical protein SEA_FAUST_200 [Streptomyces phage Faust]